MNDTERCQHSTITGHSIHATKETGGIQHLKILTYFLPLQMGVGRFSKLLNTNLYDKDKTKDKGQKTKTKDKGQKTKDKDKGQMKDKKTTNKKNT